MSKTKKLIISMAIAFLAILGICINSNAYYVGQYVDVTINAYKNNGNIYCVEHNQALRDHNYYRIISQVKIEGKKSTDYKGNTVNSWHNAKMAYILSSTDVGAVRNSVWNYMYTWLSNVGIHHSRLYQGFSNGVHGDPTYLDTESTNYANSFEEEQKTTDNTNQDSIKVKFYNKDEKDYIKVGPFNWTFPGKMKDIELEDQDGKKINNVLYSIYKGGKQQFVDASGIVSNKNFYVYVPLSTDITKLTKITGNITSSVKGATIWFLESTEGYKQNLIIREPYTAPLNIKTPFKINIPLLGNLKIIKVNEKNQEVVLPNVEFIIQNVATKKYLAKDEHNNIYYEENRESQDIIWKTDENGVIEIKNIILGNYMIYEVANPNYGYEVKTEGTPAKVESGEEYRVVLPNPQIYVKISGYVWHDIVDSKTEDGKDRNNLFAEGNETQDMLFDGITVRLKDRRTGETVKETKTGQLSEIYQGPPPEQSHYSDENGHNGHGEYLFTDVLIEELENYYIEFEYDGLTYTNVVAYIDKNNGSKASESDELRRLFNSYFSKIEGRTRNTGVTIDANGNAKFDLSYNIDPTKREAILQNFGQYLITANTDEANFNIKDHFTYGQEEIKHINLGLYEREMPEVKIGKDIYNVRLSINGYEHIYNYASRISNQGAYENGFNVGVRYEKPNGDYYKVAVYKSDYTYTNEADKSKELKAYITYTIAVDNLSDNLSTKVNRIVDYFDNRYLKDDKDDIKIGTKLDDKGLVVDEIQEQIDTQYNEGKYSKMTINLDNSPIVKAKNKTGILFVQFALSREAIATILDEQGNSNDSQRLLDNVVEIASYSTYDKDGNIYAAVDKKSAPENAIPGNEATYEDDTGKSPALRLEVATARQLTGKVFVDGTLAETQVGKVRLGDGIYKDGETGIKDVDITFTEKSGSGKVYTAKTDANGDFLIENYIPGDYTLTYTWGSDEYTVQNYKGTIYNSSRNQNDKNWHKKDVVTRYTDAIDNYNQNQDAPKGSRQQIDEEIKNINSGTKSSLTRNKMDSTTPTMGITIENVENLSEKITTSSDGDELKYKVENVDFGIVERARQQMELEKRVKSFKITLASGQVLTDAEIIEEEDARGNKVRKLAGKDTSNVTYMGPSNNYPKNGYIRAELDNELLQGSTLEVGYVIVATNKSELDYMSENYYKYGKPEGNIVTLTPLGVLDYLDNDWAFDAEQNKDWQVKKLDEIKDIVAEEVYNNPESTINEKTILYTESLKDKALAPNDTAQVELNVSKQLTVENQEILLDNEAEIVKLTKTGGAFVYNYIPGNYVPGKGKTEIDDTMAETASVTPATGEDKNYIIPITLGITTLIILSSGIVIIKKKVIDRNK